MTVDCIHTRVSGEVTLTEPLIVKKGYIYELDPNVDTHIKTNKNIIAEGGEFRANPNPGIIHTIEFEDVDETKFVGGGMVPLNSDVGLWSVNGLLNLQGQPKTEWCRAVVDLFAGDLVIKLDTAPVGWQVGDELVIVTSELHNVSRFWDKYDTCIIASVESSTVALTQSLNYNHPRCNVDGTWYGAEILNITRSVVVKGSATGRAHITILPRINEDGSHSHDNVSQTIKYVQLKNLGPRQVIPGSSHTKGVLGRYSLHFHHYGPSRSLVVGVVAVDCGNHVFVPHRSDDIIFKRCISHNTWDEPYWWDEGEPSHDIKWIDCVASKVLVSPNFRGFRLTGFVLAVGDRNVCVGCVAVGVQGNSSAPGFLWPEASKSVWFFGQCVAHNNKVCGIFTWQNTANLHIIEDFIAFRNAIGIEHGAYTNLYKFINLKLVENPIPFKLHANSAPSSMIFENSLFDTPGGLDAFVVTKHTLPANSPTVIKNSRFKGYTRSAVGFTYDLSNGSTKPEFVSIENCVKEKDPWVYFAVPPMAGSSVKVDGVEQVV